MVMCRYELDEPSADGRLKAAWRSLLAAGLVVLMCAGIAAAQSWEEYVDPEYGHSFQIPGDQFQEVSNEDGRLIFEDVSGDARIAAYQGEIPVGTGLAKIEELVASADWIRNITYRAGGNSWFVLSGHYLRDREDADPTIFYFKAMLNAERTRYSAIEISYPRSRKAEFDPVVTRIEKSLRAPR